MVRNISNAFRFIRIARHESFYEKMKNNGLSPLESVRQTLKAALVSPNFIFREEKKSDKTLGTDLLDEFALAHRMSYFLWSSIPDDHLWDLARQGKLRADLRKEFDRMIADPKIDQFVKNFCGQWLQLRDLSLVNPNPSQFPAFTGNVRESMVLETEKFFKHLLVKNLPLELLLGADFSIINQELAKYYGISGDFDNTFEKVVFRGEDLHKRRLLTHGSILTITSNPTRTSPVKRGKWVLDNLYTPKRSSTRCGGLEELHIIIVIHSPLESKWRSIRKTPPVIHATRVWIIWATPWIILMPSANGAVKMGKT